MSRSRLAVLSAIIKILPNPEIQILIAGWMACLFSLFISVLWNLNLKKNLTHITYNILAMRNMSKAIILINIGTSSSQHIEEQHLNLRTIFYFKGANLQWTLWYCHKWHALCLCFELNRCRDRADPYNWRGKKNYFVKPISLILAVDRPVISHSTRVR